VRDVLAAGLLRASDWDGFEVPEGYRAEIIQGQLVVTPGVSIRHASAHDGLAAVLRSAIPSTHRIVTGFEWRFEARGLVAMAPIPDLMVVSRNVEGTYLDHAPLLAVEVLSPSDSNLLGNGMTRREGKLADYGEHGLADFLEIDVTVSPPVAIRYELHGDRLVEVDRVVGAETLHAARPFEYQFSPQALLD
jgi:Uma2 family endonuclease